MFTPNLFCYVTPQVPDSFDRSGVPIMGKRKLERCSVARLQSQSMHTTVRSDSGASRGFAEEDVVPLSILLLTPTTTATIGSKIEISGLTLRIVSREPRYATSGRLDHYQVSGETWV